MLDQGRLHDSVGLHHRDGPSPAVLLQETVDPLETTTGDKEGPGVTPHTRPKSGCRGKRKEKDEGSSYGSNQEPQGRP